MLVEQERAACVVVRERPVFQAEERLHDAPETILRVPVEKTAFSGFDRRKGTEDQDAGVGVKNRWDWVDDVGWHGGISFLRIIVVNYNKYEIKFSTLIWLHLVHGHDTHEPALSRSTALLRRAVRSLMAQEKNMSALQPHSFLLRLLYHDH